MLGHDFYFEELCCRVLQWSMISIFCFPFYFIQIFQICKDNINDLTQKIAVTENHNAELQEEKTKLKMDLEKARYTLCWLYSVIDQSSVVVITAWTKMIDCIDINSSSAQTWRWRLRNVKALRKQWTCWEKTWRNLKKKQVFSILIILIFRHLLHTRIIFPYLLNDIFCWYIYVT